MTGNSVADNATEKPNSPSTWKRFVAKLGLNLPMVLLMFKGAVGPTIGVAIYQNSRVAAHFSTIGYLIPIMTILTVPILPQARFLQNFIATALLACLAAALSLLAMWVSTKARANTTHISESSSNGPVPGALVSPYNAAACVNMAIWFFFFVWLANTFRAYRPQYFLPSIIFGIFVNATASYGPLFALIAESEVLVRRLLETFFSGFGISFAVSLLIIPFKSRDLMSMLIMGEVQGFKSVFQAHADYMLSLSTRNLYGSKNGFTESNSSQNDDDPLKRSTHWPEADMLKKATTAIMDLQIKMTAELLWAKREIAWSKLGAEDYGNLVKLCKSILLPVLGMESLTEIVDRLERRGGWSAIRTPSDDLISEKDFNLLEEKEKAQWNLIFQQLRGPVLELQNAMAEGLDHSLYQLQLAKPPKTATKSDIEAQAANTEPGGKDFAKRLEDDIQKFLKQREGPLNEWCAEKGMDPTVERDTLKANDYHLNNRYQSQLYLILDLEYSFLMSARAILDLVKFADSKVEDGTMGKKRFIFPSWRRVKKWIIAAFTREDSNLDYQSYSTRSGTPTVYLHDAIQADRDAEHLPPTTVWEKTTDKLRGISHFIGSPESFFGFRVATATMCIMIVVFLRNSQEFFIEQRLVWGSIMVAISMSQTAGSGIYGQFLRFIGTALAMVASYIDWYIADQHTAGIIVFLGITLFLYHYPMLRWQSDPVVPMIGMVTVVLIVAYELQVQQIGIPLSSSNGQIYHPLYEIAPYRLAAVLGGVLVAFFFTYFPSVVTSRSQLRSDLGSSIYILSNYYNCVYQTVNLRIKNAEGDPKDKRSPGKKLEKARAKLFAKELILLQLMKHHTVFSSWEPSFGGRFPQASYDRLIKHTQNIIHFTTMISYVTETFSALPNRAQTQDSAISEEWLRDFKQLISSLKLTSQNVTSLLSIIAASISSGKPLPPYLKAPEPVHIGQMLVGRDPNILSTKHMFEPGYAAFAVMQVAITMLGDDLAGMLDEAKNLVGEANYGVDVLGIQGLELSGVGLKQD